jgi:hypothetical protein
MVYAIFVECLSALAYCVFVYQQSLAIFGISPDLDRRRRSRRVGNRFRHDFWSVKTEKRSEGWEMVSWTAAALKVERYRSGWRAIVWLQGV